MARFWKGSTNTYSHRNNLDSTHAVKVHTGWYDSVQYDDGNDNWSDIDEETEDLENLERDTDHADGIVILEFHGDVKAVIDEAAHEDMIVQNHLAYFKAIKLAVQNIGQSLNQKGYNSHFHGVVVHPRHFSPHEKFY